MKPYSPRPYDRAMVDSEDTSTIGTSKGVDRYKIIAKLGWLYKNWNAHTWINYSPGNTNVEFENNPFVHIPNYSVDPHTTVDLSGGYTWDNGFMLWPVGAISSMQTFRSA